LVRNPRILLAFGVLLCAAWLPFYQAVLGEFLEWDDDINITENQNIQGLDGRRLAWMFGNADYAMRYKPLSWLVWAITYKICGSRPAGFHAVNLLLHAVNTGMLFLILAKLLHGIAGRSGDDCRPWRVEIAAGVGALLWAWHPLRVEPVAWITGMPYGLALFFLLLSWLLYMQYADRPSKDSWKYYAGSVASLCLAVLAYPVGVLFVAVPLALDQAVFRRLPGDVKLWFTLEARRVWLEKLPFVIVGVAALVPTLAGRMKMGGTSMYEGPIQLGDFGVFPRMMQAFYVWAYYLWKPLVPTELAAVYPTFIWFNPAGAAFLLSALLILAITIAAVAFRRKYPGLIALWLAYLAVTVPVLGLTERPHFPSDRYAHLPNTVLAVAISIGLFRMWPATGLRSGGLAVCGLAGGLCALLSFWQTAIWKDSISLLEATLDSLGTSNYRGDIAARLGHLHARAGNSQRAAECFEVFRATGWKSAWAHGYAGTFWLQQNNLAAAQFHANAALQGESDDPTALNVLAMIALMQGDFPRVRELLSRSLTRNPQQRPMIEKVAATLDRLGKRTEAAQVRELGRNPSARPATEPPKER
jgi:tetratricopeptide (TPR) repeat protein